MSIRTCEPFCQKFDTAHLIGPRERLCEYGIHTLTCLAFNRSTITKYRVQVLCTVLRTSCLVPGVIYDTRPVWVASNEPTGPDGMGGVPSPSSAANPPSIHDTLNDTT